MALEIHEFEVTGLDEATKAPKSVKVFSTDAKTAMIIASNKHKMSAKDGKLINPSNRAEVKAKTMDNTKQLAPDHKDI